MQAVKMNPPWLTGLPGFNQHRDSTWVVGLSNASKACRRGPTAYGGWEGEMYHYDMACAGLGGAHARPAMDSLLVPSTPTPCRSSQDCRYHADMRTGVLPLSREVKSTPRNARRVFVQALGTSPGVAGALALRKSCGNESPIHKHGAVQPLGDTSPPAKVSKVPGVSEPVLKHPGTTNGPCKHLTHT